MFITKKPLEEKIARAVMEAQEKEQERRYINERFSDMHQVFDERLRYIYHRISRLEEKEKSNLRTAEVCKCEST